MLKIKNYFCLFSLLIVIINFPTSVLSDNHNLNEIIKLIQKDIKTLERAVYSENFSLNEDSESSVNTIDKNSEEVLTRHLLKLSEIEKQFQELTNKFEEINFKIDKLSSRLSKVQADNQLRFQQIENKAVTNNLTEDQKLSSLSSCLNSSEYHVFS